MVVEMSAVATVIGLTVATTTAAVLVVMLVNGDQSELAQPLMANLFPRNATSENVLLDPNGPEVQFILFTRNNSPVILRLFDNDSFTGSSFNNSNPTKIIIHGFSSSIREEIFVINKNAYLSMGDYNVIGMDWSVLCEFEYFSALRGAQKAGAVLGEFISWLTQLGVSLDDIHLVGHSLGAHVAGIGGSRIKKGKVSRISGLDPAGPGFIETKLEFKLDASDAKLVDIIHTNMRVLSLAQPVGHVDFYFNGGRFQPGCPDIYDIWRIGESLYCNHARAYHYFEEAIRNKRAFRARRCKSLDDAFKKHCVQETTVYVGDVDTYENGLYYIKTRGKSPYSLVQR